MATSPGVRVLDVPKDASQRDIKVYFSNPRHGGAKIRKIYYPLQANDAVVLFEDEKVNPKIYQHDHVLRGRGIKVRPLQRQVFTKVTVELCPKITELLDNDPKYLDDIQYDGELDVTSDDNYTITGDWYQVEWAWQYLDDVCNKDRGLTLPNGTDRHSDVTLSSHASGGTRDKEEREEDLLPLLYPHHKEMADASGFQLYSDDSWRDADDNTSKSSIGLDDISGNLDFFSRGLENTRGLPFFGNIPQKRQPKGFFLSHEDFKDIPLTYDFNIASLSVSVKMNSILKENTDAIVTSASSNLSLMFGLSRIISNAADPKLKGECVEYIDKHGPLNLGEVMHTSAGGSLDKKVGFVIHAVGPGWREESKEESTHLLTCTYINILQYASSHMWLKSIAMPLIGAGGVGFPLDVCVQAFYDALLLFVLNPENLKHLQEIRLVSNDEDSTCSTIVVLRSLLDVDQKTTQMAAQDRYLTRAKCFGSTAKSLVLCEEEETKLTEDDVKEIIEDGQENENVLRFTPERESNSFSQNKNETIAISPTETKALYSKSTHTVDNLPRNPSKTHGDSFEFQESDEESLKTSESLDESIPFATIKSDEEDKSHNEFADISKSGDRWCSPDTIQSEKGHLIPKKAKHVLDIGVEDFTRSLETEETEETVIHSKNVISDYDDQSSVRIKTDYTSEEDVLKDGKLDEKFSFGKDEENDKTEQDQIGSSPIKTIRQDKTDTSFIEIARQDQNSTNPIEIAKQDKIDTSSIGVGKQDQTNTSHIETARQCHTNTGPSETARQGQNGAPSIEIVRQDQESSSHIETVTQGPLSLSKTYNEKDGQNEGTISPVETYSDDFID